MLKENVSSSEPHLWWKLDDVCVVLEEITLFPQQLIILWDLPGQFFKKAPNALHHMCYLESSGLQGHNQHQLNSN